MLIYPNFILIIFLSRAKYFHGIISCVALLYVQNNPEQKNNKFAGKLIITYKTQLLQRFCKNYCQQIKTIMKKSFLIASVTCLFLFVACSKTTPSKNNEVFIRVQNATTENLTNLNFMGADFGSITAGDSTNYQSFQNVIPYPFANLLTINYTYSYIQDVVPGLYLENGKYTLQLLTDTLPYRYKASFIKE